MRPDVDAFLNKNGFSLCVVYISVVYGIIREERSGVMNIKKMGNFLKLLRKEKGMTQEQLAQMLNVAGRTVSRWETGNNLPDLDILIALSDFYEIDIREIINGERKEKEMDAAQKETVQAVAEYSKEKETRHMGHIIGIVVSGILAWSVSLAVTLGFLNNVKHGILVLVFTVIGFALYCACVLLNRSCRSVRGYLTALIGGFSAVIVSNIALMLVFFGTGSYHNWGLAGVYYALGIVLAAFLCSGIVVTIINKKTLSKG